MLSTLFVWDETEEATYPSSLPGFFPDIVMSHCKQQPFNLPTLSDGMDLILGLLDGAHLGASALAGFPSLNTLPHQGTLGFHSVNVFQSDSRNQSMIITLDPQDREKTGDIANALIGQKMYHSWPYLQEGLVVAVSDDMFKFELQQLPGKAPKIVAQGHNHYATGAWSKSADHIEHHYSKRFGVIIGSVDIILHVRPLKGQSICIRTRTGADLD